MALDSDGNGYAVVKTVTGEGNKTYVKVKQVDDTSVKNYLNVKETDGEKKDYLEVVVVDYDSPKDYVRVNFIDAPVDTRWYMRFNGASFIELDSSINVRSSNGASLEFMCVFPTFLVESTENLFGRVGSTSNFGNISIGSEGTFGSNLGDIMIDGVLSTEYPRDGKAHYVYIDVSASYKSINSISTFNYDRFFSGMMWDIKFTNSDSGDWFIPLNEPFTEDHLIYDSNGDILGTKYNDVADDYTQTEPS